MTVRHRPHDLAADKSLNIASCVDSRPLTFFTVLAMLSFAKQLKLAKKQSNEPKPVRASQ